MRIIEITKQLTTDGGVIMWPLGITSLLIWFLLTYRALLLSNHRFCNRNDLDRIGQTLKLGKPLESSPEFKKLGGIQRMLVLSLGAAEKDKWNVMMDDWEEFCRKSIIDNARIVRVLIKTAPLLGLLGTVWGMIETFNVISLAGTSEPKLIARGISIAMLTTQAGLLIAVPALYVEGRVSRWEQKIIRRVDETRLVLIKCLAEK